MSLDSSSGVPDPFDKSNYQAVDQRKNIHELPVGSAWTQRVKQEVGSVACLVFQHQLHETRHGWSISAKVPKLHQRLECLFDGIFGEKELFRDEPCLGYGTVFLIGKRLALTAGHCIAEPKDPNDFSSKWIQSCKRINDFIVFGFQTTAKDTYQENFDKKDVYRIANVVAFRKDLKEDWAIVMLDREVENRAVLSLNFFDFVSSQNFPPVYMLGHPSGLPAKYTDNAVVKKSSNEHFFEANLDAFEGNSGSPVLNKEGKVIGILVRGNRDYEVVPNYKGTGQRRICVQRTSEKEILLKGYEKCQRISSMNFLRGVLSSIDIPRMIESAVKQGLSLIGRCNKQKCSASSSLIVIPVGDGFGRFSLARVSDESSCPNCHEPIPSENVNTMVLSSCKYRIEGGNIQKACINEKFRLVGEMQFDITRWKYIMLEVKQLK